jgi:hypothetical protein
VPWLVLTGKSAEGLSKALLMLAAWLINIAVAEWIIRSRITPRRLAEPARTPADVAG